MRLGAAAAICALRTAARVAAARANAVQLVRMPTLFGIPAAALLVVGTSLLVGCGSDDRRREVSIVPVAEESCLGCHANESGFSAFHQPAAIGCVSCHAGDPTDTTEAGSHERMIAVPGNLDVARTTCGGETCHPSIVERVETSLMATGRGIVAVNRWVFGEQFTPNGTDGFADLRGSHADEHLRQLCSSCHLGYEKVAPAPVDELSRGGGCVACHIQYSDSTTHPALTIQITNDHCFGCHSRSGRISTNYEGWHETLLTPEDVAAEDIEAVDTGSEDGASKNAASEDARPANATSGDPVYRVLADGRVFEKKQEDVHHALGLACIDCHSSRETMGDGLIYLHQDAAVEISCADCHTQERPPTASWGELDRESRTILLLRYGRELPERSFVTTEATNQPLVNVFVDSSGAPVVEGKLSGVRYTPAAPVAACTQSGHERLSCQSCHTAWVAQCQGCHTQLTDGGEWREFASDFFADPPTLGLREDPHTGEARVEPFAPGMIMTLNTHPRALAADVEELAAEGSFHRLFAPGAPHTTDADGRTCESCHNSPLALGYGRGKLELEGNRPAHWTFDPDFETLRDGLPADAWIPFLQTRPDLGATRLNARPFNRTEQQRILRVGACLTCHGGTSEIYENFDAALREMTTFCRTTNVEAAH